MKFPDWSDRSAAYEFVAPHVLKFMDAVKNLSSTNEYKAEIWQHYGDDIHHLYDQIREAQSERDESYFDDIPF